MAVLHDEELKALMNQLWFDDSTYHTLLAEGMLVPQLRALFLGHREETLIVTFFLIVL